MELTQYTDYSLRVLIYLGELKDRKATIREIAEYYKISANHLMKIIPYLVHKGYIRSVRGKGGGILLAKAPESIKIGEVVRETEKNMELVECFKPGKGSCALLPDCSLKSALHEAMEHFLNSLDQYTLAALLETPKSKSVSKEVIGISKSYSKKG
jgi:Rrf2 family nitric oxide-sensitive transcriptional repressor